MRSDDARLVSDGRSVRWTLERIYREQPGRVRVDWLRFTVPLDAIVKRDHLLPPDTDALSLMERDERDLIRQTRSADAADYTGAMAVARSAVGSVSQMLGVFEVGAVEDKGMDFYAARCGFMHESAVVGYALAGGKSSAQAGTVHINLFGSAALHVSHAKWSVIANWLAEVGGHITRVDLALDVFTGIDMPSVQEAWKAGEFDQRGKRPRQREVGSWSSGHSRTFQVGTRETGKVCRIYEKGDELFGEEENDPWVRVECEFRSNHRVIDLEVLTHPADFFAGAYPYCAALADEHACEAEPATIKTFAGSAGALLAKVAEAAAIRSVRWFRRTAAPTYCRLLLDGANVLESVFDSEFSRTPRRFLGFSRDELRLALEKVASGLAPSDTPLANGAA